MGLAEFLESAPEEEGGQFTYAGLSELSGISAEDAHDLADEWRGWGEQRMTNFLARLCGLAEDDALLEFDAVFKQALASPFPGARRLAVTGLAECDDRVLVSRLLDLMRRDDAEEVRIEAAFALARFTAMAADGKLLDKDVERLRSTLLDTLNDAREADPVRRRALETAAIFGGDEVATRIRAAYMSGDHEEIKSAVYAMGRTSDPAWLPEVLAQLSNIDPTIRFEAARALGEIGEESHAFNLAESLDDLDPVVASAAAVSLARLGGQAARRLLQQATESEHDAVAQAARNALHELTMENVLFEDEPGVFGITPEEVVHHAAPQEDDIGADDDDWPYSDEELEIVDAYGEFEYDEDDDAPLVVGEFDDGDDVDELDLEDEADPFDR